MHKKINPVQRLRALARLERAEIAVVVVYAAAIGVVSLAVPIAAQALVNAVASTALVQPLVVLAILVLFGLLAAGALRALQYSVVETLQQRLFIRTAHAATLSLIHSAKAGLSVESARARTRRFLDIAIAQKGAAALLLDGVSIALQGTISLVLLAFYHPVLLAFDALLILFILLSVFGLGRGGVATAVNESKAKYNTADWLDEIASKLPDFERKDSTLGALARTDELGREYLRARRQHFAVLFRQVVASFLLQAIASAALLGLGGSLVLQGQLTLGQLVAAELIVTGVLAGVAKFGKQLEHFYDLAAALDKLGHVADIADEAPGQGTFAPSLAETEERLKSSKPRRTLAQLLLVALAVGIAVLYFTPWQQSAPGGGRVVAYAPAERQQPIEAPIDGRIQKWFVQEGQTVKKGHLIVELTDNDPEVLMRLRNERDAVVDRLNAARQRAISLEARIDSLEDSKRNALLAADSRVLMAEQRVRAAEQGVALAEATLHTATLNGERQRSLTQQGLTSERQLEITELEQTRARTEVLRANAALSAAQSEEAAFNSERTKVKNDASAAINDARATQSGAEAEVANVSAELARIEVRLARQSAQSVTAPSDGTLLRIIANGHSGEIVKAGDMLAALVPSSTENAVELWVSGNDMPLVREGAAARVQFEGWPALQFSGWPSIAVGTFAGRVSFIDSHDNGEGKFRVLVLPAPGATWPSNVYLRQGVRTEGWVQLGRVRLGYELWRQFNGFPPSLPKEPSPARKDQFNSGNGGKK
jgi:membrane fusion protein, adhesin transport system